MRKVSPWLVDGRLVEAGKASIPLESPLSQWGLGVFSTGIVIANTLLAGTLHVKRLLKDASSLGIESPTKEELTALITYWLSSIETSEKPMRVKILLTPSMKPSIMAYSLREESKDAPLSLMLRPDAMVPKNAPWSRYKMASYAEYQLLHNMAETHGYDGVLLVNGTQQVVETAKAAFWFTVGDTLLYPCPSLNGLESISHLTMMEVCQRCKLAYKPWIGTVEEIPEEARCYISNCVQMIRAVASIGTSFRYAVDPETVRAYNTLLHEAMHSDAIGITMHRGS